LETGRRSRHRPDGVPGRRRFCPIGRAWREADLETTNLETVIQHMLAGEYHDPIRVIAFNTAERWSEDVSEDVARELQRRCDIQLTDVPAKAL
jgi:hypothetical protein